MVTVTTLDRAIAAEIHLVIMAATDLISSPEHNGQGIHWAAVAAPPVTW